MRWLARLFAAVGLVLAAVSAVFLIGMRRKSPVVQDAVRRRSRAMKPYVLKTAGTSGNAISVVRHVGRKSGNTYETPVTAAPVDDWFVIALPYGAGTDWVENVLAASSAELVNDGTTYQVEQPEVIPLAEVGHHFPPSARRAHRWFGVDEGLRVHAVGVAANDPIVEGV